MHHQGHVNTDDICAEVCMTSFVEELHRARKKRLQRFKVAAENKRTKEAVIADDRQAVALQKILDESEAKLWTERQKEQWFEIVEEISPPVARIPSVEEIARAVCKYFDMPRNEFVSNRRVAAVSYPRHVAMYLARSMTQKSFPYIGRRLGGRDHTTVIHGAKKIAAALKTDWLVAYDVAHVEAML